MYSMLESFIKVLGVLGLIVICYMAFAVFGGAFEDDVNEHLFYCESVEQGQPNYKEWNMEKLCSDDMKEKLKKSLQ